jgi:hypothetical protein
MATPEVALAAYRDNVETFEQAMPVLVMGFPDGIHVVMLRVPKGVPTDFAILTGGAVARSKAGVTPLWVHFVSEAWRESLTSEQFMAFCEAKDGGVSLDEFSPTRTEVVVAYGVSRDGSWCVAQPFERKDGGVVWGEVETMNPAEDQGAVVVALQALVEVPA